MSYTPGYTKEILVTTAGQLSGTLDSTIVYTIDGVVDMGSVEITVPTTGLFLRGLDYHVSGLTSTENSHTMFKTAGGTYAGSVKLSMLYLTSSGTSSKLFDLDNDGNSGSVEFNSCNIGDFSDTTTSLGELTAYRQFRTADCGFFRVQDGLTFSGTWSGGFKIVDTIVLSQAASSTLFKVGTSLVFSGRSISDINASSVDATTITFDFDEANFTRDGGFQLNGASFVANSSISVTLPETSTKALFSNCIEIRDSTPGFEMKWTSDTSTPLTLNTPVQANGTTVTSNNTWFSQTANNQVTYNSTLIKDVLITAPISVLGGAGDQITIQIRRRDNSGSAYEIIKAKTRSIETFISGSDIAIYNITARIDDMGEDDRIEVWIINITDGTAATVQSGSEVFAQIL